MSRNKFSNRCRITIVQCLPNDLIETQQAFLAYIMYMCIDHDYLLGLIANIDETPITFDLSSNIIINETGAQSVSIQTIGYQKTNFTVVLTCMADRMKLPLYITMN